MKARKTICSIILLVGSILTSYSLAGTLDVNSYELCSASASSSVWLKGSLSTPQKRSFHSQSQSFGLGRTELFDKFG